MSNPHPSRSKPYKIGRKHTGAPGLREIGRRASGIISANAQRIAKIRAYKAEVAKWWAGDRETFPSKPKII